MDDAKRFCPKHNLAATTSIVFCDHVSFSNTCHMKRIYSRFRIALMTFTLGLAAVYMSNGLAVAWNEVPVKLPTAVSSNVLAVFPDTSRLLTREKNCGKDPADPQARLDCENDRIFEDRDMTLYAKYEITCDPPESDRVLYHCGQEKDFRELRNMVWRHWGEKRRTHIIFKYAGDWWREEEHYFLEPGRNNTWRLVIKRVGFANLWVDNKRTKVRMVNSNKAYSQRQWKNAPEDDAPHRLRPGRRYLEFSDERGYTDYF